MIIFLPIILKYNIQVSTICFAQATCELPAEPLDINNNFKYVITGKGTLHPEKSECKSSGTWRSN